MKYIIGLIAIALIIFCFSFVISESKQNTYKTDWGIVKDSPIRR